jgi:hypothetical protein
MATNTQRAWDPKSPAISATIPPPPTSTAVVGSASPSTASAGVSLTFSVNGSGFTEASVVSADSVALTTIFVSTTLVRATYAFPVARVYAISVDGSNSVTMTVA